MRFSFIALPLLALAACQPQAPAENPTPPARPAEMAVPTTPDTTTAPADTAATDTARRVTPGRSLGRLRLGEDAATALAPLGKPAFGDAAMQKAWGTWYTQGQPSTQLDVYTAPQGNDVDHHTVQLVRATAPVFRLANGLHVGSTLAAIQQAYAQPLPQAGSYQLKAGRRFLYDDVAGGVAFETDGPGAGSQCRALIVHLPGRAVAGVALPIAEYLKQLK
jgi:hypothetical protein